MSKVEIIVSVVGFSSAYLFATSTVSLSLRHNLFPDEVKFPKQLDLFFMLFGMGIAFWASAFPKGFNSTGLPIISLIGEINIVEIFRKLERGTLFASVKGAKA